jgi:uncharacterized protein
MEIPLSNKFKEAVDKDKRIIAVLLFGSYSRGEHYRDIDVCIVLDKKYSSLQMSKERLKFSSILPTKFDVQVFQQLPVYIRKRILKDGKVIICKDEDLLYDIAYETIKEFSLFEKTYNTYLAGVKNG